MVYAIYDTTGIQSYIFASTKLKENVGASELVGQVFNDYLPEALEKAFTKAEVITDWKNQTARTAHWTPTKTAEIIYVGGGNAYVAYKSVRAYEEATGVLLRRVYDETATIGIASAYIETDFTTGYVNQHNALMQALVQAKGEINRPITTGSQPITKTSLLTGLPVTHLQDNEQISQDQYLKRNAKKRNANEEGPETFDDLKRGNTSFLGVLHIDGNNVGRHIESYMETSDNWKAAVPKIREMSYRISKLYKKAYEITRQNFEEFYKSPRNKQHYDKGDLPLLKLIDDGDDITCVLTGLWSISFAAQLLREIEAQGKNADLYPFKDWPECETKPHVSACAGVVIFHSHYPFSEAYRMAEECCKNAKRYTRDADKHTNGIAGSFIDFHIHHGGAVTDLKSLRRALFHTGDEYEDALTHSPFFVLNPSVTDADTIKLFKDKYPSFCDFDNLVRSWARQDKDTPGENRPDKDTATGKPWPRSRLKALRDAIASGEDEVQKILDWCEARGYVLPPGYIACTAADDIAEGHQLNKYALLFSVLEFADIYENISEGVEE